MLIRHLWAVVKWRGRTVIVVINLITLALLFHFSASIPPPHPIPACRGEGHDSGSHLPHPASPLLPWNVSFQHYDVGPIGTTQHPQTLEPELSAACTPFTTLCSPLLQGSEGQCFYVVKTSLYFYLCWFSDCLPFFAPHVQDLSKSPKSVKKLLPKRKPERKQSEEEFALRKSMFGIFPIYVQSLCWTQMHRNVIF